jgi:DNA-binding FadR family transcriptional regulator
MASTESRTRVKNVLLDAPRPLTERMVMERSGLSVNTVREALQELEVPRQQVANAFVYTLHKDDKPAARLTWRKNNPLAQSTGEHAAVDLLDINAVPDYNRMVHRIATALPARLAPDTDPRQAAQALSEYAVVLTTIAAQLQRYQDDPEWWLRLGGATERMEI